jgi:hypothetical protein
VCGAPLCGQHVEVGTPAVLSDYDDDTDDYYPALFPTVQAGLDRAVTSGWRIVDEHAVCAWCAADHAPNPDRYGGC